MRAWSHFNVDPDQHGSDGQSGADPEAQSAAEAQHPRRDAGPTGNARRSAEYASETGTAVNSDPAPAITIQFRATGKPEWFRGAALRSRPPGNRV